MSQGEFEAAAAATETNFGLAPGTVVYCREAMFDEMHSAARVFVIDAR